MDPNNSLEMRNIGAWCLSAFLIFTAFFTFFFVFPISVICGAVGAVFSMAYGKTVAAMLAEKLERIVEDGSRSDSISEEKPVENSPERPKTVSEIRKMFEGAPFFGNLFGTARPNNSLMEESSNKTTVSDNINENTKSLNFKEQYDRVMKNILEMCKTSENSAENFAESEKNSSDVRNVVDQIVKDVENQNAFEKAEPPTEIQKSPEIIQGISQKSSQTAGKIQDPIKTDQEKVEISLEKLAEIQERTVKSAENLEEISDSADKLEDQEKPVGVEKDAESIENQDNFEKSSPKLITPIEVPEKVETVSEVQESSVSSENLNERVEKETEINENHSIFNENQENVNTLPQTAAEVSSQNVDVQSGADKAIAEETNDVNLTENLDGKESVPAEDIMETSLEAQTPANESHADQQETVDHPHSNEDSTFAPDLETIETPTVCQRESQEEFVKPTIVEKDVETSCENVKHSDPSGKNNSAGDFAEPPNHENIDNITEKLKTSSDIFQIAYVSTENLGDLIKKSADTSIEIQKIEHSSVNVFGVDRSLIGILEIPPAVVEKDIKNQETNTVNMEASVGTDKIAVELLGEDSGDIADTQTGSEKSEESIKENKIFSKYDYPTSEEYTGPLEITARSLDIAGIPFCCEVPSNEIQDCSETDPEIKNPVNVDNIEEVPEKLDDYIKEHEIASEMDHPISDGFARPEDNTSSAQKIDDIPTSHEVTSCTTEFSSEKLADNANQALVEEVKKVSEKSDDSIKEHQIRSDIVEIPANITEKPAKVLGIPLESFKNSTEAQTLVEKFVEVPSQTQEEVGNEVNSNTNKDDQVKITTENTENQDIIKTIVEIPSENQENAVKINHIPENLEISSPSSSPIKKILQKSITPGQTPPDTPTKKASRFEEIVEKSSRNSSPRKMDSNGKSAKAAQKHFQALQIPTEILSTTANLLKIPEDLDSFSDKMVRYSSATDKILFLVTFRDVSTLTEISTDDKNIARIPLKKRKIKILKLEGNSEQLTSIMAGILKKVTENLTGSATWIYFLKSNEAESAEQIAETHQVDIKKIAREIYGPSTMIAKNLAHMSSEFLALNADGWIWFNAGNQ